MFDIITDFASVVNTCIKKSYPKIHPPKSKYILSGKYGNNFSFTECKLPPTSFINLRQFKNFQNYTL